MASVTGWLAQKVTDVRHAVHETGKALHEAAFTELKESAFEEKGVVTPAEFVEAGDQLVYKCKTWQWAPADKGKEWPFLPKDKQFLITRSVPCLQRVAALIGDANAREEMVEDADGDGGWLSTHADRKVVASIEDIGEIDDLTIDDELGETEAATATNVIQIQEHKSLNQEQIVETADDDEFDMCDIDDIDELPDDFFDDAVVDEKQDQKVPDAQQSSAAPMLRATEPADSAFVKCRTYDMTITYDKYYQVPRLWLKGKDEGQEPLTSAQMMEDISSDHAKKTVTVEGHPHTGDKVTGIHPCRHSEVMTRIIQQMKKRGDKLAVKDYMFLFLKFMSAVIPTINYDFTSDFGKT